MVRGAEGRSWRNAIRAVRHKRSGVRRYAPCPRDCSGKGVSGLPGAPRRAAPRRQQAARNLPLPAAIDISFPECCRSSIAGWGIANRSEFPFRLPEARKKVSTLTDRKLIDAVLLDMDGTILNSIKAAERVWGRWAERHGLDVEAFLTTIHGVQSVETIRRLGLPGVDPVAEAAAITRAEMDDVDGIEAIAGAAGFLSALAGGRWAVVTSAPRGLALRRIEAARLPVPPLLIAAEDVVRGKPAPDCFNLAATRLGTTADQCLVIEDSMAGVTAAERAGAAVLIVTATHHRPIDTRHAAISDYRDLVVETASAGAILIRHAATARRGRAPISWLLETGRSDA